MAVSVLTIGLLAVASMQVAAIKGNVSSMEVKEATTWATDQMESLLALPYDDALLEDTDGDGFDGLNDSTIDTADHPPVLHGKYAVYWNVAVDDVIGNSKTVNVVVTWADHGRQRRFVLQNLLPHT